MEASGHDQLRHGRLGSHHWGFPRLPTLSLPPIPTLALVQGYGARTMIISHGGLSTIRSRFMASRWELQLDPSLPVTMVKVRTITGEVLLANLKRYPYP